MHGLVLRLNHEKNALGKYMLLLTVRSAPAKGEGASLGGVPVPHLRGCHPYKPPETTSRTLPAAPKLQSPEKRFLSKAEASQL